MGLPIHKTLILSIGITAIALRCFSQALIVNLVPDSVLKSRLESGKVGRGERENALRDLFREASCAAQEQPVDKKTGNVICTLPGASNLDIVVGGHFDYVEHGEGIVDDWSGASMLPSLYQAMKGRPRRHSFVFVGFAAEERGLVGSAKYVKNLSSEEKNRIRSFVNLECLGLSPTKVWVNRSNVDLTQLLSEAAQQASLPLKGMNVDRVGDDDTHSFLSEHIPVISIHSLTQETLPILHSDRDTMRAIHLADYSTTYKLVAYYLAYLDEKLP